MLTQPQLMDLVYSRFTDLWCTWSRCSSLNSARRVPQTSQHDLTAFLLNFSSKIACQSATRIVSWIDQTCCFPFSFDASLQSNSSLLRIYFANCSCSSLAASVLLCVVCMLVPACVHVFPRFRFLSLRVRCASCDSRAQQFAFDYCWSCQSFHTHTHTHTLTHLSLSPSTQGLSLYPPPSAFVWS